MKHVAQKKFHLGYYFDKRLLFSYVIISSTGLIIPVAIEEFRLGGLFYYGQLRSSCTAFSYYLSLEITCNECPTIICKRQLLNILM